MSLEKLTDNIAFAFTVLDGRHEVHARYMNYHETRKGRRTRAYVGVTDSEVPMDQPPHGSHRGDGSAEDKLWKKFNHLELVIMRLKLARATAALFAAGYVSAGTRWAFSRKAGCSCSCSPGFVLNGTAEAAGRPVEIWVS